MSRIDQLAEKLGTTAANVWGIYVRQAGVEGVRDSVVGAVLILVSGLSFFGLSRAEEEENKGWLFVFGLLFLGSSLVWFYSASGEILNPQYWAFQHLTADLKNLF